MTLTHTESVAQIARARDAGHGSVAEYCLVLEAALRAIGGAPDAGPWAPVARLALLGHFAAADPFGEVNRWARG